MASSSLREAATLKFVRKCLKTTIEEEEYVAAGLLLKRE